MKKLRTKIREAMINVYGDTLSETGTASRMADAVLKRVERHIEKQKRKKKSLLG